MRITRRQLRRIIREQLEQEPGFTPEQRKIGRLFTRFDRAQIRQALNLNKTLGLLPEPTAISFPQEDWLDMSDEERREMEKLPIDKYPHDRPEQPNVLVDITFATPEDAEMWRQLWVEEAGGCARGESVYDCYSLSSSAGGLSDDGTRFWIWAKAKDRMIR